MFETTSLEGLIVPGLWVAFAVVMVIYGIVTMVLLYHWKTYSISADLSTKVTKRYFMISGILIAVAVLSILSYMFSI